jgi:drug/metabolite transporter (DMT)-like permease
MTPRSISWLLLIFLSAVWGSSFILMKRGLDTFSSDEVAALRISIAFISLLPLMIRLISLLPLMIRHYKIELRKYLKGLLIMGVFGNLIPAFLFTAAETQISSSLAGMLNSLTPLFTIIIGIMWTKMHPTKRQVWGVFIGLLAAIGLICFEKGMMELGNFSGAGLVIIATVCYAISVNSIRKYLTGLNPVKATVWAFTFTGPTALIYLLGFTDVATDLASKPGAVTSLGYVTILGMLGTALSVVLYNILIRNAGVLFASSCTYLIPIVALLWGVGAGEAVNFPQLISIGTIILGVYLINYD